LFNFNIILLGFRLSMCRLA